MKNFIQDGKTYDFIAPAAVTSGTPVLISKLLVIPVHDADSGARFAGTIEGVFTLTAAAADTPAQGDLAYWDNTAKEVTTVSVGNTFCGHFMEAKLAAVTSAIVKLQAAVS